MDKVQSSRCRFPWDSGSWETGRGAREGSWEWGAERAGHQYHCEEAGAGDGCVMSPDPQKRKGSELPGRPR